MIRKMRQLFKLKPVKAVPLSAAFAFGCYIDKTPRGYRLYIAGKPIYQVQATFETQQDAMIYAEFYFDLTGKEFSD